MNINSQNVSQAEEVFELASKDLISFGKLFLPDDFMRSETPPFHYEVSDSIDDKSVKQLAIILPRGHGKTVLTKASILKDFVFCPKDGLAPSVPCESVSSEKFISPNNASTPDNSIPLTNFSSQFFCAQYLGFFI